MPDKLICSRCGSDALIPRVRVTDRGNDNMRYDLQIEVQRRPNALIFKRSEHFTLSARVCCACGIAEFYVEAPSALYTAYMQADAGPAASALEELERTREALADSQIRLRELEEKLDFVEQMLEGDNPKRALPKGE